MSAGIRAHRWPAGFRLLALGIVVLATLWLTAAAIAHRQRQGTVASPAAAPLSYPARLASLGTTPGAPGPGGDPARKTLVLYDEGADAPLLGHQYAIQAANLSSRGGSWTLQPVTRYQAGDLDRYQGAIYVGATDSSLPPPFLSDVIRSGVPVLWMGAGIGQIFSHDATAARRLGWTSAGPDPLKVTGVEYRGRTLTRGQDNEPLTRISVTDASAVQVVGLAVHADGSTSPWAVRSGSFTYVGDLPFSDVRPGDRYLAAADLILRLVDPRAPERHRALIRIEDVGPNTDPADIVAIADFLAGRGVPFSLAVYPYYLDPHGAMNNGKPTAARLIDRPELVAALKYAAQRGGVVIMHGYTHQFESLDNPYTGTSGADYEFFLAHVDADNNVQLDGPVPPDSESWVANRLAVGRAEFVRAGLPDPDIFEFPHYTASAASYHAVAEMFGVRYDQGSYFDGLCPHGDCGRPTGSMGEMFQQFFPYPVRDVYGSVVIPEDLENISEPYNNNPARTASDIIADAAATLVVRDGVASAFYHPYLGVGELAKVVDGITALGYTFVSPYDVLK